MNVQGRDYILIHLANDAKKELLGCIAPVAKHTGIGKGSKSLTALEKLKTLVYTVFDRNEEVKISILDSCLRGKDKRERQKRKIIKIVERIKVPTPRFFKILRSIGLVLLVISGTVVA